MIQVKIPTNTVRLVTERTHKLQQVRPLFLSHFVAARQMIDEELAEVLRTSDAPLESDEVRRLLGELESFVDGEVRSIASRAKELVRIAEAMSKTHVAEERDHAAAFSPQDPLCGLYWALTPRVLEQWQTLWTLETWEQEWRDKTGEAALAKTLQVLNTVETLVIHQVDDRLRTAFRLKEALLAEQ